LRLQPATSIRPLCGALCRNSSGIDVVPEEYNDRAFGRDAGLGRQRIEWWPDLPRIGLTCVAHQEQRRLDLIRGDFLERHTVVTRARCDCEQSHRDACTSARVAEVQSAAIGKTD
jgi:hypothetical protein